MAHSISLYRDYDITMTREPNRKRPHPKLPPDLRSKHRLVRHAPAPTLAGQQASSVKA